MLLKQRRTEGGDQLYIHIYYGQFNIHNIDTSTGLGTLLASGFGLRQCLQHLRDLVGVHVVQSDTLLFSKFCRESEQESEFIAHTVHEFVLLQTRTTN